MRKKPDEPLWEIILRARNRGRAFDLAITALFVPADLPNAFQAERLARLCEGDRARIALMAKSEDEAIRARTVAGEWFSRRCEITVLTPCAKD